MQAIMLADSKVKKILRFNIQTGRESAIFDFQLNVLPTDTMEYSNLRNRNFLNLSDVHDMQKYV